MIPADMSLDTQSQSAVHLNEDIHSKHIEELKRCDDWYVIFNYNVRSQLDVSLIHNFELTTTVSCLEFSTDGRIIAAGCSGAVVIYDCQTGDKVATFRDEEAGLVTTTPKRICFRPDGRHIVGIMPDRMKIWNLGTGETRNVNLGLGNERILATSEDGTMLVTPNEDTIKLWDLDVDRGVLIAKRTVLETKFGVDNLMAATISADKQFVAGGGPQGHVIVWDTESGAVVSCSKICEEKVDILKFSSNGYRLLVGSYSSTVRLLDLSALNEERPQSNHSDAIVQIFPRQGAYWVYALSWSKDDKYIMSGDGDGSVCLWDDNGNPQFILGHAHMSYGIRGGRVIANLGLS